MSPLSCTLACVLSAALCCISTALLYQHEAGTILYPYGTDMGDTPLYIPYDGSIEQPFDTAVTFPFFNQEFNRFWINENGLISFEHPVSQYRGQYFPQDPPGIGRVIAPFWADVDLTQLSTANDGMIFYRETFDEGILDRASDDVKRVFGNQYRIFEASWAAIITWHEVTFIQADQSGQSGELTNTFQCVLVTDGLFSFAMFHYGEINWSLTNGDHAQVGYDANDQVHHFVVEDAQTADIINIHGSHYFRLDADVPSPQQCLLDGRFPRVRLTYGRQGNTMQGNAEIKIPGAGWRSICDVGWGDDDATVFCNQLGFPGPATATRNGHFQRRAIPFAMDKVRCEGNETCILDCLHGDDPNPTKCKPGDEAGAICHGAPVNEIDIRLAGAIDEREGSIELRVDERFPDGSIERKFGRICDDGWGENEANVLCRHLGYSNGKHTRRSFFTSPHNHLDFAARVHCVGNETRIEECDIRNVPLDCVNDGNEAGVICFGAEHPIRLWDGNREGDYQGNVEIRVGRKYHRICDEGWGDVEAAIVCNQKDMPGPAQGLRNSYYGERDHLPFLTFKCQGDETKLFDCLKPFAGNECSTNKAASVMCTDPDV